ncbi:MAG: PqqD family protein [Acidimicrobiales bacterium]
MYKQASHILAEELDGEVLAIDERTGTYYSMSGTAVAVWNRLITGADATELCEEIVAQFPAVQNEIREDFTAFESQLKEAGLIEVAVGDSNAMAPEQRLKPISWGTDGWSTPVIGVHAEMQDILLFDPVHQVDYDKGWPHQPNVG